ncbi:unnamed protein product [Prunus brigantina]
MSSFQYFTLFTLCSTIFYSMDGIEVRKIIKSQQTEKTSHLHFFFHDILSGKDPSAARIAGPLNSTITTFGATMMIDDALTEKQEPTSKIVGRAQGLYSVAAQRDHEFALLVAYYHSVDNGSALSILGRNPFFQGTREMPIIGGTGVSGMQGAMHW